MSWLTSFETLLNKVDQAAGQALHKDGGWAEGEGAVGGSLSDQSRLSAPAPDRPDNFGHHSPYLSETKPASQISKSPSFTKSSSDISKRAGTPADEELFEFLNSPSTNGKTENRSRSRASEDGSRTPSSGSSKPPGRLTPAEGFVITSTENIGKRDSDSGGSDMSIISSVAEGGVASVGGGEELGEGRHRDVERENELLRNEISSLNLEMSSVVQRIRGLQDELQQSQQKLATQSRQLSQSEQIARELRSRENDLQESLNVKDTQLSVLRSKLEEADKEVEAKKRRVEQLQKDRDRILEDQSSSTGVQSQALDTLQDKLRESEAALHTLQQQHHHEKMVWQDRERKLESDKQDLMTEISSLQRNINKEKSQNSDIAAQLKTSRSQMESAKQDLQEYKDKATRILQSKDRLIASLKEGGGTEGVADGVGGASVGLLTAELETTKQERDVLREELQAAQLSLESLRAELSEAESALQQEVESGREAVSSLEDQISVERRRREDLELETGRQKQELRYVHEELLKQKNSLQSRIQDRDTEITRLRNQLTTKAVSGSSEQELEGRLHQLTESLIHKQTIVEALSTDKSSLILQLERLEKQCKQSEAAARTNHSSASINIPEEDEVRQRGGAGFMNESPFDGQMTRRVKLAANTIDRFSMRLGRFLRQYPIARVFIIIYMALLHLWVMIVLLTYQPEMHHDSYQPNEPKS